MFYDGKVNLFAVFSQVWMQIWRFLVGYKWKQAILEPPLVALSALCSCTIHIIAEESLPSADSDHL